MCQLKILISSLICFCFASEQKEAYWWHKKAEIMVKNQLERRGIKNEGVLRVMQETPRHYFVPENQRDVAYEDGPLPIGEGQTISQPYIVALMTELLQLKGKERVLEIGTGSGYQTAIISHLCKKVYTIEIFNKLLSKAKINLSKSKIKNVTYSLDNGINGWRAVPFAKNNGVLRMIIIRFFIII